MAFNIRSIAGRNARPQLTGQDMQTANDHGITSKRVARKNIDSIRQVQEGNKGRTGGIYGNEVNSDYDPFSNPRSPEQDAAGQKLASLGKPAKRELKRPSSMPSVMGNYGKKSVTKQPPPDKRMNPFDPMTSWND